jgi:hypothetical protein
VYNKNNAEEDRSVENKEESGTGSKKNSFKKNKKNKK